MIPHALAMGGLGIAGAVPIGGKFSSRQGKVARVASLDIFYYDRGTGPVLLLLHGMFGDITDWEPVLEPLSRTHRVIAIDLPGFGESSKPAVDYTADFFVSAFDALLDHLKIARAVLVGNSFGGVICMLYGLQHPSRVQGMVLIGSGGFHDWSAEERGLAQTRFRKDNLRNLTPAIHRLIFDPIFVNKSSAAKTAYLKKQDAKLARSDFEEYVHAIHSSVQLALDACLLGRLSEIASPVLIIQGEGDQVVQMEWAKDGARRLPRAQLEVLKDCGHVPQLEAPREVAALVAAFAAKL